MILISKHLWLGSISVSNIYHERDTLDSRNIDTGKALDNFEIQRNGYACVKDNSYNYCSRRKMDAIHTFLIEKNYFKKLFQSSNLTNDLCKS